MDEKEAEARPLMGTIFLVYVHRGPKSTGGITWAKRALIGRAKRAPHWGVQSRFRVIYMYMYICRYVSYVKLTA